MAKNEKNTHIIIIFHYQGIEENCQTNYSLEIFKTSK